MENRDPIQGIDEEPIDTIEVPEYDEEDELDV